MTAGVSTEANWHDLADEGNALVATYRDVSRQYALGFVEHPLGSWLVLQHCLRDSAAERVSDDMSLFQTIDARVAQGLVLGKDKCPHVPIENRPIVFCDDDPYREVL